MPEIVWACWGEGGDAPPIAMFIDSLRRFGGSLAQCPVRVYLREDEAHASDWARIDAEVKTFPMEPAVAGIPYASKPLAAAAAETDAADCGTLVWFDAMSLVSGDPAVLRLAPGEDLAYRPVELQNIGCPEGESPDPFWNRIYGAFGLTPAAAFPMVTTCDRQRVRAYVNAAMLATRPATGLMSLWRSAFLRLAAEGGWEPLFGERPERAYYLHQAMLTGAILSHLPSSRMRELPHTVSYPLHLQARMPQGQRLNDLSGLTLCRYYDFFEDPCWPDRLSVSAEQQDFLAAHGIQVGPR